MKYIIRILVFIIICMAGYYSYIYIKKRQQNHIDTQQQSAFVIDSQTFSEIAPICNAIKGLDVDVTLFGAVASDRNPDSHAIKNAVACLIRKSRLNKGQTGALVFPAGTFIVDAQIILDKLIWFDTSGLTIKGAGPTQTVLIAENPDGIFDIDIDRVGISVNIEDMRLVPGRANITSAVVVTGVDQGSTHHSTFQMRRVDIGGEKGKPNTQYNFVDAVKLYAVYRPIFDTVFISGAYGPNVSDTVKRKMKSCFNLEDVYTPQIIQSRCWSAEYGVRYYTNKPYGSAGPEGGLISQSKFVEVDTGIYVKSLSQEPAFIVTESHVNARKNGIKIDGRKFVQIINNLFYQEDPKVSLYTDIQLNGVVRSIVQGNIFHIPAYQSSITGERHMIALDSLTISNRNKKKTKDILITNNIFSAFGTPIAIASGLEDGVYAYNNIGNSDIFETAPAGAIQPTPPEEPKVVEKSPNHVKVIFPNDGSVHIQKGTSVDLKWSDTVKGAYQYFVSLRGKNTANNQLLTNHATGGTYTWNVPSTIPSGKYTVLVCRRGYVDVPEGRCDQSDKLFTID